MAAEERVGLVGVGLVGTALAERLLAAGYAVTGYDVDPSRRDALTERGGQAVDGAARVAEAAGTVVLSLPDTHAVRKAVEGPSGLLSGGRTPRFVLDTTTGDPDETAALAGRLRAHGVAFLDGPLSGSSAQIRDGAGAVALVGGDRDAFDACRPVLGVLAPKVFYLGPSGSGSRAKLATNLVLGLNRLALAEGLVFAEQLGLDLPAFLEVLKASPAYSAAMDAKGGKMLAHDWSPDSRIRQHRKDVGIMLRQAAASGQELPLTALHRELLDAAIAAGDGDLDNAAILREIERRRESPR